MDSGRPDGATFADWRWRASTLKGHMLIALAREHGLSHEAAEQLFQAACVPMNSGPNLKRRWLARQPPKTCLRVVESVPALTLPASAPSDPPRFAHRALPPRPPLCSYEQGKNVSDTAVLLEIAGKLGLEEEARQRLGAASSGGASGSSAAPADSSRAGAGVECGEGEGAACGAAPGPAPAPAGEEEGVDGELLTSVQQDDATAKTRSVLLYPSLAAGCL